MHETTPPYCTAESAEMSKIRRLCISTDSIPHATSGRHSGEVCDVKHLSCRPTIRTTWRCHCYPKFIVMLFIEATSETTFLKNTCAYFSVVTMFIVKINSLICHCHCVACRVRFKRLLIFIIRIEFNLIFYSKMLLYSIFHNWHWLTLHWAVMVHTTYSAELHF